MKQEFKPLSWKVKNFDCNKQVIEDYDVLKYREDMIKKLKKKYKTKEEFEKALRLEFRCQFWSRCEYELIIEFTEDEGSSLDFAYEAYNLENVTLSDDSYLITCDKNIEIKITFTDKI